MNEQMTDAEQSTCGNKSRPLDFVDVVVPSYSWQRYVVYTFLTAIGTVVAILVLANATPGGDGLICVVSLPILIGVAILLLHMDTAERIAETAASIEKNDNEDNIRKHLVSTNATRRGVFYQQHAKRWAKQLWSHTGRAMPIRIMWTRKTSRPVVPLRQLFEPQSISEISPGFSERVCEKQDHPGFSR